MELSGQNMRQNGYTCRVNEKYAPNGTKLFREEYWLNPRGETDSDLWHCHSFAESVWFPEYQGYAGGGHGLTVWSRIVSGRMYYQDDEQQRLLEPGEFVIFPPFRPCRVTVAGDRPVVRASVLMASTPAYRVWQQSVFPGGLTVIRPDDPAEFEQLLDDIKQAALTAPERIGGRIFRLAEAVFRTIRRPAYPEPLQRALDCLALHPGETLDVSAIAAQARISERSLNRLFRQYFQCSCGQYRMEQQLTRMARLLSLHAMSVKEAATWCGFADSGYAIRRFRRRFGVTPGEFRDQRGGMSSEA